MKKVEIPQGFIKFYHTICKIDGCKISRDGNNIIVRHYSTDGTYIRTVNFKMDGNKGEIVFINSSSEKVKT